MGRSLIMTASVFDATLTLQEFFLILLWIALIGLVVMLTAILFKTYQTMKDIREVVADNKNNINRILNEFPDITKNIQEVTVEVSHAAQVLRPSVDNIADTSESITKTLKDNNPVNEAIVSTYKAVNNVHKLVESVARKTEKKNQTN